ncbi:UTRA domain-containing protein [Streptomyces sp. Edi4]|uniref:GntR family transcriptional regulator n=1 Tax=Streptomyces sp. Edi4 TaxID=3162527 RepID=UPI003305BC16
MSVGEWVSSSLPYLAVHGGGSAADAWKAEGAARGGTGRQRIVYAGEVAAPAEVSVAFEGPEGMPVVIRRRVMYLDEQPCELTDSYYPLSIARGTPLAGTAKIRGGAVRLLAELGHTGVRVREDVLAALPDDEAQDVLGLAPGAPVLRIVRTTMDADDRAIQVDMMTMPAALQRLRYEVRIG